MDAIINQAKVVLVAVKNFETVDIPKEKTVSSRSEDIDVDESNNSRINQWSSMLSRQKRRCVMVG